MIKPCCVCGVKDHVENMNGIWFVDEEPMEQWMCQHCWDDVNGRLPTQRAVDLRDSAASDDLPTPPANH